MKSKAFIAIVLTISILQLSFSNKKNDNWKLVKNKNGIKAYTSEQENSSVNRVKVTTSIKTSLTALTSVLKDFSSHKNWIYNCILTQKMKVISETEYYFYTKSKAPWPISYRDIVTHTVIKQDKKTKTVTFTATGKPNYIKKKEGIVRVKKLNGRWEFIPHKNGIVDLRFYLLIDAGGTLPTWVVNAAIAEGPFQTVQNLVKQVQKEKYKNIKLSFIEELL